MNNTYEINELRLKNRPEIIKIDNNNYIIISEYKKRESTFFDVKFNNKGKEIFWVDT